jgi:hypothetical protein
MNSDLPAWLQIALLVAVPLLLLSVGRRLLFSLPLSTCAWAVLVAAAGTGLVHWRSASGLVAGAADALFLGIPVMQALTHVLADRIFNVSMGREPLSFYQARFGPSHKGARIAWPDRIFWFIFCVPWLLGGIWVLIHYGFDTPHRHGVS